VALVISVLLFSTLVKNLLIMVNDLLVARVAQSIARDVRMQIFNQAVKVDRAAFSGWGPSGFLSHITHTSHMLADGMMHVFGGAIREPLKGLSCLIGAGFICWRLLLMSLITAPLAGFTIVWVGKRLKGVSRRVLKRGHSYHEVMLETLNNIQTVQAYGMEADEQKRFADATAEMRRCSLQVTFYNTLTKPVTELVGIAMIGTAVIAGSYLVLSGDTKVWGIEITNRPLSVSSMLIFFGLLVGASDPVRKLSSVFAGIHTGAVAADHLYELLDYDSKIKEPAEPQSAPRPHREIVVHHLTFGYRHDSPVLRDAELRLPFGKTIAVVGANGSGKSTLVQLLCRFYDPQQGVITIDGVDLRRLSLRDLRSRIAVVSQRTELFNRSIMANILYGSPEATEEQARRAAQLAYAEDFIRHLPDGYATQVGTDGHRLSGGQRQRIALARAILRNPDLLILDEATSQIDMESEFLIRQSLAEFARGRSTLIITHREALLALADEVYQMEEGHLVRVPHQLGQQAA
jgi:ATP-binding cassette subfamily B protein/subfamily B ATP-binding cassette protein MsbA